MDPTQPEERGEPLSNNQMPVFFLTVLGALAIIGLIVLAYTPGSETQFIQNTLGTIAVASVAAIAGLVRGGSA